MQLSHHPEQLQNNPAEEGYPHDLPFRTDALPFSQPFPHTLS